MSSGLARRSEHAVGHHSRISGSDAMTSGLQGGVIVLVVIAAYLES